VNNHKLNTQIIATLLHNHRSTLADAGYKYSTQHNFNFAHGIRLVLNWIPLGDLYIIMCLACLDEPLFSIITYRVACLEPLISIIT